MHVKRTFEIGLPFAAAIALMGVGPLGCEADTPREEIAQAVETVEEKLGQQPEESRDAFQERLAIYVQKLDELENKAGQAVAKDLRQAADDLQAKLTALKDAPLEEWKTKRAELNKLLDELIAAYKKAEAQAEQGAPGLDKAGSEG